MGTAVCVCFSKQQANKQQPSVKMEELPGIGRPNSATHTFIIIISSSSSNAHCRLTSVRSQRARTPPRYRSTSSGSTLPSCCTGGGAGCSADDSLMRRFPVSRSCGVLAARPSTVPICLYGTLVVYKMNCAMIYDRPFAVRLHL